GAGQEVALARPAERALLVLAPLPGGQRGQEPRIIVRGRPPAWLVRPLGVGDGQAVDPLWPAHSSPPERSDSNSDSSAAARRSCGSVSLGRGDQPHLASRSVSRRISLRTSHSGT